MTPEMKYDLCGKAIQVAVLLVGVLGAYLKLKEQVGQAKAAGDKAREAGEENATKIHEVHVIVNSQKTQLLERIDKLEKQILGTAASTGLPPAKTQGDAVDSILKGGEKGEVTPPGHAPPSP
jgi:hypothetical protein